MRHTIGVVEMMSERALQTRAALLKAAREVFINSGYAAANVTDIVEMAGSSVGSLYHHFGGKSDLYVALWEDYQSRQQHRAANAFRSALAAGETDPVKLFVAGARAYLEGCWAERQLAQLFLSGGGPPGFEQRSRQLFRTWLRRNSRLLQEEGHPLDDTLVLVLTTVATEAGREVAVQPSKARAYRFIEEILQLMGRLYPPD